MANNNQTDTEYLVSCMWIKSLSEFTPEELKEYYEDQRNEELIDEELMRRAEERWEEYEPEYYGDEDLDLENE